MAKKDRHLRLLPAATAPPQHMAMAHYHSPKRRKRNAGVGGGSLLGEKSPILPIIAGAGGALVAAVGAEKLGMNPNVAAWGTAAVGAATALGTRGMIRQVATGVGAAGMCLGAIQLLASARAESSKKQQAQHSAQKRQAENPYVTRDELNDALARQAEQHKQSNCDLVTAIREEMKKVVDEAKAEKAPPPKPATVHQMFRSAPGEDEYMRNAYGEDYERNAYAEDERNAYVDEERNAYVDDERNAYGEEEYLRNAYGEEYERNAYAEDERNAFADEERNGAGDEERNSGEEFAQAA